MDADEKRIPQSDLPKYFEFRIPAILWNIVVRGGFLDDVILQRPAFLPTLREVLACACTRLSADGSLIGGNILDLLVHCQTNRAGGYYTTQNDSNAI